MLAHITKHRPIAPAGITIQQEATIIPTPDEPATPAHIKHTDHTEVGRNTFKERKEKEQGVRKNTFYIFQLTYFFFTLAQHDILQHALFCGKNFVASIFDKKGVSQECAVVRLVFFSAFIK